MLDTIMGCKAGTAEDPRGCYHDCYSARSARIRGFDFRNNINRKFKDHNHINAIREKIKRLGVDFIRVGSSGDPSGDWEHTIGVLEALKGLGVCFTVVTKHWTRLTTNQLKRLSQLNVVINTSVSAIDKNLFDRLRIYEELKGYCSSVLRVVSFKFNPDSDKGIAHNLTQEFLFNSYDAIETVFRCSPKNPLVIDGTIIAEKSTFLGDACWTSNNNPRAYFGECGGCLEKCGLSVHLKSGDQVSLSLPAER